MEKDLQEIAAARGLSESNRLKSLPERTAALGMSREAIDRVRKYLDAFETLNARGGVDKLRADVKRELAARADAELTGAELLANIVQTHRSGREK
jgi:hypothetical protein